MYFALTSAVLHWCWVTAHLYEERVSTGVVAGITAALARAKCMINCSMLLGKTGSQRACTLQLHLCGHLLFIQVCSDPAQMQCSTVQGRMHSSLFSDAMQNRVTACLCRCSHTKRDLLFIQVCSDPAQMHFSSIQGKMHSPLLL